jgi:hypothetical protein
MVAGGDSRGGAPVVSVAELIARDAPWSGAPDAVDVTGGRPSAAIPAQRASSRPDGRPETGTATRAVPRTAARAVPQGRAGHPLRRFVAAAWSPNWRLITVCAGLLVAGLLSNVVLLTATSGPDGGTRAAGSDEGGYPTDVVDEPPDLSIEPPPATLPGLGLPLALSSLGQTVPAARPTPAATSALVGSPATRSGSVTTGSVTTGSGTTSSGTTAGSSRTPVNDGSLGGTVAGVGRVAGGTVEGLGGVVGGPVGSTVKDLGRTTEHLTDTVGETVNGLLGGSSGSRDSDSRESDSDDSRDARDARDSDDGARSESAGGNLLGGLLGGN